jgi:hypothetical protein
MVQAIFEIIKIEILFIEHIQILKIFNSLDLLGHSQGISIIMIIIILRNDLFLTEKQYQNLMSMSFLMKKTILFLLVFSDLHKKNGKMEQAI